MNPKKATLVQLRNVMTSQGAHILLRKIDWTIREGECWASVGPSGSGKTTIAEALAGQRHVTRGEIVYPFAADDVPSSGDIILISSESQMDACLDISPYYQARWNSAEEEQRCTVRHFLSAQGIYGASE